jgi:hypothetical protein
MKLENIILSEVSQAQKTKNHVFSLIRDCRPKTNTSNIIGHGSHAKGRMCMAEIGKGKKT